MYAIKIALMDLQSHIHYIVFEFNFLLRDRQLIIYLDFSLLKEWFTQKLKLC